MRAIFISYRRDDSEGQAGRLFDDLANHFGHDAVFMDVAGIAFGRDFRRVIDEHVASCGVLLAIIGKAWINAQDASGRRRLDDPADFVRLETASALKRDIPVIPVLVQGASMPQAEQLPPDLAELAFRNGIELSHARWDSDVQLLIKALEPYVQARRVEPESETASAAAGAAGAAEPATAGGGSAGAQQRVKRSYLAMTVGLVAAAAVALGAYKWYAGSAQLPQTTQKPAAMPGLDRPAGAKESESPGSAIREAAASAAEADRLAAAKRDREALAAKKAADRKEADRLAATRAADKREADRLAANKAAADQAVAEQAAADKAVADAAAEKLAQERRDREGRQLAAERAAAAHRARWPSYNFPPPNGGSVVFTIMPDGNPACASYNAASCLWGVSYEQLDFTRLRPLVCGEAHRARWGVTGYEDPKHWCNLAKKVRTVGMAVR